MTRPLILGMVSPIPGCLHPDIPGAAGNRLWRMTELDLGDYEAAFERRNLLPTGKCWNAMLARERGGVLRSILINRDVVVLGGNVWRALSLPISADIVWDPMGNTFYHVPHPSGRNRYYNDPENRERVGHLLWRLAG